MIKPGTGGDHRTKEGAQGAGRLFLHPEGCTAGRALGAGGQVGYGLLFDHMALELGEELLGFGEGQPELFDTFGLLL